MEKVSNFITAVTKKEMIVPTLESGSVISCQKYVNANISSGSAVSSATNPSGYKPFALKCRQILGFELDGTFYPLPMEKVGNVVVNVDGYALFIFAFSSDSYVVQWCANNKHSGKKVVFTLWE